MHGAGRRASGMRPQNTHGEDGCQPPFEGMESLFQSSGIYSSAVYYRISMYMSCALSLFLALVT